MGFLTNGVTSGGIPMHLVDTLLSVEPIPYFVETGTQGGESFSKMIPLFKECHSIELTKKETQKVGHVTIHAGNSAEELPKIIEKLDGNYCLFWLDAHYSDSGPNTTGYPECPLMDEIRAVSKYHNAVILIDDLRLFCGFAIWPLDNREWPKIADIIVELKGSFPHHYTTIVDDYIICVPHAFKDAIDKEWRDRYHIRYPSPEDKLKTEVKSVYNSFKKYVGD